MSQPTTLRASQGTILWNKVKTFFSKPHNVILLLLGIVLTFTTVAPIVVTGAERMAVAQQILKALEANDIVGGAASVDVTQVDDIVLWYGSRYQVMLGDSANLSYKIACMYDAILQMSDYQTGILDVSFTQWENRVALTPFE